MRKKLVSMLGAGALFLASACASRPSTYTTDISSGSKIDRITEKSYATPSIESLVMHGTRVYTQSNESPKRQNNELGVRFSTYDSTPIVNDTNSQKIEARASAYFIPTRMMQDEKTPSKRVILNNVKVTRGKQVNPNEEIEVINEREEDIAYNIRTAYIPGIGECFIPKIEDAIHLTGDALNFIIVPKEGTNIITNPDNTITLEREEGIYRAIKVSAKEWEARGVAPTTKPTDQSKLGTASRIE